MTNTFFTPVIDAQLECLNAAKKIAQKMNVLFEALLIKGVIEKSYSVIIRPMNSGYEICSLCSRKLANYNGENNDLYLIADKMRSVVIEPEVFYNDNHYVNKDAKINYTYYNAESKSISCGCVFCPRLDDEGEKAACSVIVLRVWKSIDFAIKTVKELGRKDDEPNKELVKSFLQTYYLRKSAMSLDEAREWLEKAKLDLPTTEAIWKEIKLNPYK